MSFVDLYGVIVLWMACPLLCLILFCPVLIWFVCCALMCRTCGASYCIAYVLCELEIYWHFYWLYFCLQWKLRVCDLMSQILISPVWFIINRTSWYFMYFMVLHVLHGTSCNPHRTLWWVEVLVFWVMVGALYNRTHNNWVKWSTNLIIQCISAVPCDLGRVCLGLEIGASSEVMTT